MQLKPLVSTQKLIFMEPEPVLLLFCSLDVPPCAAWTHIAYTNQYRGPTTRRRGGGCVQSASSLCTFLSGHPLFWGRRRSNSIVTSVFIGCTIYIPGSTILLRRGNGRLARACEYAWGGRGWWCAPTADAHRTVSSPLFLLLFSSPPS